jgi:F-type H+-transporting ATPase subunit a
MRVLRFLQEHAEAPSADAAQHSAEAAGHSQDFDLGEMIIHHVTDAREWELEPFGALHLPQWDPIHIAGLTIDLSPTKHVLFMVAAAVITGIVGIIVARAVAGRYVKDAPSGFANAVEAIIVYFRDEVVRANIGHGYERFTPFILTLFFFILTMNLLGLVPWGATATGNLSVTAALAVVSFFVTEISGFRELGARGYAKTIFYAPEGMSFGWTALMYVVMTPVEFLGKLTKPFALAIRLFANMTAGHVLILSLLGAIFLFGNIMIGRWAIAGASVGMAVAVMCLELFVAFLQAYIFAMLTAVFIGMIRHPH